MDVFKLAFVVLGMFLLFILYHCYGFAQANGIETIVVFKTALAILAVSGVMAWVATVVGVTEGFCAWLVLCWICLCPMLGALAEVNSIGPSLYYGATDPKWYGTWWFQWGFGVALAGFGAFLLKHKHRYY